MTNTLNDRLGLDSLDYPVPKYSNSIKYMLGGITIFCILLAVISGVFLAQFYNPSPADANASVAYISSGVYLGDFMRSVHFWSANIATLLIIFHIVRVFIYGSYKRPREATWLSGVLLLVIMVSLFYSGTVLKWDQEAVEAQGHLDAISERFGYVGKIFLSSADNSTPYLSRLYVAHVGILMLALFAVLFVHLFLIKKQGISPKLSLKAVTKATRGIGNSNFRVHLKKLTGFGFLTIALVATLALLAPATLGPPGVAGIEQTKPPWLFLPLYGLENKFGINALLWAPLVILCLMVILPFVDRNQWVSPRRRKVVISIGSLLIAALVVLGYNAWRSPTHSHLGTGRLNITHQLSTLLFPKALAHGSSEPSSSHTDTEATHEDMAVPVQDNNARTNYKASELAIIASVIIVFTFAGAVILLR